MADSPGADLALLLLAGFRSLVDELHARLAAEGHPGLRPSYGFALQAIGAEGATASELGRRLGVSKQAAGKTVVALERLGYVTRTEDGADARRTRVRLTKRGADVLARSAAIFDELRGEWAGRVGADRLRGIETSLVALTGEASLRLDTAGWFGHRRDAAP
jgi:DNA-binding MarR family transcriptional regulator